MPQDLVNFLKNAGPLQKHDGGSTAATAPRKHKLPRWATSNADDKESSSSPPPTGSGGSTSSSNRRVVESMPLAEKIEGFATTKSTSFSQQAPEVDPHIYQWGTTLNIYQLLQQKEQYRNHPPTGSSNKTSDDMELDSMAYDDIVQQTYDAYGHQFPLPPPDVAQRQQTLLKHTLQYLDNPILMKDDQDNADSYDGIPPSQVATYETMKLQIVPPTRARLVLEDLHDMEPKEGKKTLQATSSKERY
jgi:hypothetical protein